MKLFLIKSLALITLVVACATTYSGFGKPLLGIFTSKDNAKALESSYKYSIDGAYSDGNRGEYKLSDAASFKNHFCNGNKPKRNIKISAALPMLAIKDAPLSVTQKFQLKLKDYYQRLSKNIFSWGIAVDG